MKSDKQFHIPRKRFGQNFLHDGMVIEQIINSIAPTPQETLVEIGPGLGALTQPLLKSVAQLHVVELDRDIIPRLLETCKAGGKLIVHEADALKFDFCTLGQSLRLVGNLPYNISTPLLFHLFDQIACIHDMTFMLQKEVVEIL